ncbi:MAG: hypothetical protein LAQ30_11735 [Acidobacteriia bacterium]|nr:hypothetical protein [Terriglobia bacterium]
MKPILFLLSAAVALGQPLRLEKTIPLPGVQGRIDHLAVDLEGKRLFVAALGNNTLEVLGVETGRRLASIAGLREPQGVAYPPGIKKIYVANGADGRLRVYDGATLQPAGEVVFGGDADNVRYDAARRVLWVGYGSGALGALDAASGKRAGDVKLDAHPESFQLEKSGARIFVNAPDAAEIEVVDRERRAVAAKWPVKAAGANFPMALDEADHRLFVGCRRPARLLVLDTENSGALVAELPCAGDADDLFYDAARKRVYVIGGEGSISVFEQRSPDDYRLLAKVATAEGARTGLYVPEWSRLFVAVRQRAAGAAEIRVFRAE